MALNKARIDPKAKPADAAAETAVAEPQVADTTLDWDEANKAGTTVAAPAASPAPAAQTAGTAVQAQPASGGALMHAAEDDGFSALDSAIGFGSFPIIKLDKGKYWFGEEELGEEFQGAIGGVRKKHLFKMDDDHLVYSYNGTHDDSGKPLEAHYMEWKAAGIDKPVTQSTYMEVVVLITSSKDGKFDGRFGLCSVPPRSTNRLGGYRAEMRMGKGKKLGEIITRFVVGKLVQVSKSISFNPWEFLFGGLYTPPKED